MNMKNMNRENNSFEKRVSIHFLFNSLNSVIALCYKDPEAAAELTGEISTYLQKSLEGKPPLIALDEELEHVLSYINIQRARFSDRLKVVLDIDENIRCLIPAFTLQPIVDNAIRHGILKRKHGGIVNIIIRKHDHTVQFCIADDGIGISSEIINSMFKRYNKQHSLYRVNKSLKKAGFKGLIIRSGHSSGTEVAFEIPLLN